MCKGSTFRCIGSSVTGNQEIIPRFHENQYYFYPTGDGEVAKDAQLQVHAVPADIHYEDNARRSTMKLKSCVPSETVFLVDAVPGSDMEE